MNRRDILKILSILVISMGIGACGNVLSKTGEDERAEAGEKLKRNYEVMKNQERQKRAEEVEARKVEELYSTKPIRFRLGEHEYVVPVNYFTPKGRDNVEAGQSEGFGFYLFLPDYGGYTKENWQDSFDPRLIEVLQVKPVDKNIMIPRTDGTSHRISPDNYGDPKSGFESLRSLYESSPSLKLYGLEGYRRRGASKSVIWVGTRSNSEFFFFQASLPPGEPLVSRTDYPEYPICDVRYYSEKEDLYIVYRYSQQHIEKWREIDDAIWAKIHSWRVK